MPFSTKDSLAAEDGSGSAMSIGASVLGQQNMSFDALEQALDKCSGNFKRLVSPLLPYRVTLSYLEGELHACRQRSRGSAQECNMAFALKMEESGVKQHLEELQATMKAHLAHYEKDRVEEKWIRNFQNQVDYVPGLSKGKRLLDAESATQHIGLAEEMKASGNQAFAARDFSMALTRYSQGVELLANVECKLRPRHAELEQLFVTLLTNQVRVGSFNAKKEETSLASHAQEQAVAALRTDSWRVAVAACSTCLELEPNNLKARVRRAEARLALGEVEPAASDFYYILSVADHAVTDSTLLQAARKDARRGLADIAKAREKERGVARRMLADSRWSEGQGNSSSNRGIREGPSAAQAVGPDSAQPSNDQTAEPVRRSSNDTILTEESATALQNDLMALYQMEYVQKELIEMRKAADYEEGRFIRRLRPFLIRIVGPCLQQYSLGTGEEGYKTMEKALAQHLGTSPEVKENTKSLLALLMGDLFDM